MKNNYKFFQNRDCEFFPCHKIENEDSFNCLFCYCPLYLKENCLGSPDYILNGKGQKIRDCSNCTIVHRPEMYETVIAQFQKQDCVVFVSIWDLKDEIMARIAEIASWEQMDPESRKEHKDEAEKTVMRFLSRYNNRNRYLVPVLLQPFSRDCIKSDGFMLGKKNISCRILERIDPSKITQGYLYAFHAPEIRIEEMDSLVFRQIATQKGIRVELMDTRAELDGTMVELLGGIETIRALDSAQIEENRILGRSEQLRRKEMRHHRAMAFYDCLKFINEAVFSVLVIGISVLLAAQNRISVGTVLTAYLCFTQLTGPLRELHRILDEFSDPINPCFACSSVL